MRGESITINPEKARNKKRGRSEKDIINNMDDDIKAFLKAGGKILKIKSGITGDKFNKSSPNHYSKFDYGNKNE